MSSSGNDYGWGPPPGAHEPEKQASTPSAYGLPQLGPVRPRAPKPGIIPLRPLGMGEVLDGAFSAIRHNPRVMFGLSFIVAAISSIVSLPLLYMVAGDVMEWLVSLSSGRGAANLDLSNGQIIALVGTGLLQFIMMIVLTGLLIGSVSRSVIGQQISVREAWDMSKRRVLPLIVLSVFVALFVLLTSTLTMVPFATLAGFDIGREALVPIAGVCFLVTLALLTVRSSLSAPALVLEVRGPIRSIRRSMALTKGSFWRLTGAVVVALLIAAIVSGVITQPISLLANTLFADTGNSLIPAIISAVAQALSSVVVTPFLASVFCLLYINLRIRNEDLHLQLEQAAREARA